MAVDISITYRRVFTPSMNVPIQKMAASLRSFASRPQASALQAAHCARRSSFPDYGSSCIRSYNLAYQIMMSLERIQDQIGYLVLNEDGAVIASGGELENSEHVANVVTGLLSLADSVLPDEDGYKKISVTYPNFSYVICLSNKKVYIVKKKHSWSAAPPAPFQSLIDLEPNNVPIA